MCGRYANDIQDVEKWTGVFGDWPYDMPVGFNVAPTQTVPVVTAGGGRGMRWGLIPPWSKDASGKYATFNARIESAADKPTFRGAWQQDQTCLVPALGYYEWRKEGDIKQPYFVHDTSGAPLVFAGLWDSWQSTNDSLLSCTILTQAAAGPLKDLHPRMPLMLGLEQAYGWLQDGTKVLGRDGGPCLPADLGMHPVSRQVSSVRNQGAGLIEPADKPPEQGVLL